MKKKSVLCFALSILMVLSLTACGKKTNQTEDAMADSSDIVQEDQDKTEVEVEESVSEAVDESASDSGTVHTLHLTRAKAYDYYYDEEYNKLLATMSYPCILLEDCCAQNYQALSKSLAELNESEKSIATAQYNELVAAAKSDIAENFSFDYQYELEETASVRRADSNVLSLLYCGYMYSGGVHGSGYYWGENIDAATGNKIKLADVVTDVNALPELIKTQLIKYYGSEGFYTDLDLGTYLSENLDSLTWVLDYNGITFYFDPYEIGPYAAGTFIAAIPFAENPDLFTEKYKSVPDSYGIELLEYDPFYFDLNNDGTLDELSIYGTWGSYGDVLEYHRISINDNLYESETWAYSIDMQLIHTVDGKNYIYIQDTSDNDFEIMTVYNVSNGYTEKVGSVNLGWHETYVEEADYWCLEQIATDPGHMKLDTRTDLLSTVTAYKNYRVDTTGMPITDDKWYIFESPLSFTVKQNFEADVIDEISGEKLAGTTVKAGDSVLYYRTDGESVADFKLSDGSVVRVNVDKTNWPRTISGIDIEELFDGTLFAG